jgi:hypothetical protein
MLIRPMCLKSDGPPRAVAAATHQDRVLRLLPLIEDEAREEEHSPEVRTRGLKQSSTFRNYTQFEPRFRVLLTEGDTKTFLL